MEHAHANDLFYFHRYGLLLPFRAFDQVARAWCTFGFSSLDRETNEKMICCRRSWGTLTKCTSQPWNACLIIKILSSIDGGVLLLMCKHLHVCLGTALWLVSQRYGRSSCLFYLDLGTSHGFWATTQSVSSPTCSFLLSKLKTIWVISIEIIFILQPQQWTQQFSIFVLLAPVVLFFTIHEFASRTSGYISYGIM